MIQQEKERGEFRVEPLSRAHDWAAFHCGAPALDNYLKRQASQDVAKRVAVCFVLTSDGHTIAGFYTLSQYSIDFRVLQTEFTKRLPRYPDVPATLLGRLAIAQEFMGQGLGEFLLSDALDRALRHSRQVASAAVIVDAKDERARRFYLSFGFVPVVGIPNRLYLPTATLEELLARSGSTHL